MTTQENTIPEYEVNEQEEQFWAECEAEHQDNPYYQVEADPLDAMEPDFNGSIWSDEPEPPLDMFAGRVDDLPLFSGTAPRATVKPFIEKPVGRQERLF